MKRQKNFLSLGILFFACLFFAPKTLACSCFALPPIYEAFDRADAVFIGKVVDTNEPKEGDKNYDGRDVIFDFEVVENLKGVSGKQVKLNRGRRDNSCYSGYAVGETYLVYADYEGNGVFQRNPEKTEGTVFQGDFCNRTTHITTAWDQLFFIREMLKGKPEPQIYGSIARSDTDPVSYKHRHDFLAGIKIVVENDKNRFETVTDKNGLYTFNNIPAGEYFVKPEPGEDYMVYWSAVEKIQILADKTIGVLSRYGPDVETAYDAFYKNFLLGWNNRIDGRVIDSQGRPFQRYVLGLFPVARANNELFPDEEGTPDDHRETGDFWVYGRTPGKYVLAVDIYAPFGTSVKKRFFYPQAESLKDAKVFDLAASTKLKDVDIKIPFFIRYIKGEVFWSDGTPNKSQCWITLSKLEAKNDKNNTIFDSVSARDGKFTIAALEGFEYWIHAVVFVDVKGTNTELEINSKPQKIKIGKEDVPLKIVFEKPKNLAEDK